MYSSAFFIFLFQLEQERENILQIDDEDEEKTKQNKLLLIEAKPRVWWIMKSFLFFNSLNLVVIGFHS